MSRNYKTPVEALLYFASCQVATFESLPKSTSIYDAARQLSVASSMIRAARLFEAEPLCPIVQRLKQAWLSTPEERRNKIVKRYLEMSGAAHDTTTDIELGIRSPKTLGDYPNKSLITAKVVAFENGWPEPQQRWLNENKGKRVSGQVELSEGTTYFRPHGIDGLILAEDEIEDEQPA